MKWIHYALATLEHPFLCAKLVLPFSEDERILSKKATNQWRSKSVHQPNKTIRERHQYLTGKMIASCACLTRTSILLCYVSLSSFKDKLVSSIKVTKRHEFDMEIPFLSTSKQVDNREYSTYLLFLPDNIWQSVKIRLSTLANKKTR